MTTLITLFKRTSFTIALLCIVWAFFDVGRRVIGHWASLAHRPIELTVLHWGDPAEDKIVDDLVQNFQKEHGDVHIVRINAGGDFPNKIKTMMAADIAPDVFYLPPALVPEFVDNKLIAPLDDRFNKEPDAVRNDFWPILIDSLRYEQKTGELGKGPLWGLPKDFTTTVFYANTDLFDKAGIDWRAIQKTGWDWATFEADMKKITALSADPTFAGRTIYGSIMDLWPAILQNVLGTYDGQFFTANGDGTPNFSKLALDQPPAQKALDLIARMRLTDKTCYNSTGIAKDGGQEFLNGNIGCTGPLGQWKVPQFRGITGFNWDILPVPSGTRRASPVIYTGWAMSSHTRHPDQAYDLIRFLCGRDGQVQQGRAGLAIPALQSVANSDDFLRPPGYPGKDEGQFLNAAKFAQLAPMPKQSEFVDILSNNINLAIQAGRLTPMQAADKVQAEWSHELSSPLRAQAWPEMPWKPILALLAAVLGSVAIFLFFKAKREKLGPLDRATERAGFSFVAPWVIGFTALTLGPMIVSLLLAFTQWTGLIPLQNAKFVGTANFRQLFGYDSLFYQSLKVTAYFVLLGVPLGQITALLIAMLMNSRVKGIAFFRTVYFIPSVISGAALAVLWLQLFNNDYGLINGLLRPVLGLMHLRPPNWFGYDQSVTPPVLDAARWAVPGFVLMGLWGVGSGMIIYLAGLKGISPSLYEAARIDGAGPVRQAWNVTIPMLSPLIFYNLVMGIIGSFQVFTQAYVMTGDGPEHATLFYVLSLYRNAFEYHNMGYASAMAWVLFVIVLVLTLAVFKGSKSLVYYEGLK